MNRLHEFFEDDKGRLSMTRLTTFGAFFVSSFVMVKLTQDKLMSAETLGLFLGIFVVGYGMSRTADCYNKLTESKNAPVVPQQP